MTEYSGDGYAAFHAMCGQKKPKEIAHYLIFKHGIWAPDDGAEVTPKDLRTAEDRVRQCLNPNMRQYFKMAEIVAISKWTDCFDAIFFMCDELGLSRPYAMSQQEQLGKLEQAVNRAVDVIANATKAMDNLTEQGRDELDDTVVKMPARMFSRQRQVY